MRRLVVLALAALAAGCGGETSARLTVRPATTAPVSLRLQLWGEGLLRTPVDLPLDSHQLPGTVLIRHLDARTPDFRVLADGLDAMGTITSEGGVHVPLTDGQESSVVLQLQDGRLADSDGDGVPDLVDDCPSVADPDQLCSAPHRDGAVDFATGGDLAGVDLAGLDFAAPPDAALDLAVPPDLRNADLARKPACPSFAFFCDDFETGNFDVTKWGTLYNAGGGSTLTVDPSLAWSGIQSAHASATGGLIWAPHVFTPVTSGKLAMRAYFYNGPALAPSVYMFYLHRQGTAPVDADYVVGYDNFSGSGQWTVYNKNGGGTPYNMLGSTAEDTWHCIELDITINGDGSNQVEFFVDDVESPSVTVPVGQGATTLGEFDIGVSYQSGSTANKYHIDDVALATQHIGCE